MQKLHLVGVNLTRNGLIFSDQRGSRAGSFVVPVTAELAELVAELIGGAGAGDGEAAAKRPADVESLLSVREIQARLRGGRSVAEIAEAAGVPPDWVERFAPPIRAEQQRIIALATEARLRRARLGPSAEPLGRAVAQNLAAKGVRLTPGEVAAGWSAYHRIDDSWIVHHEHTLRGRRSLATWEFDEGAGALVPGDRRSAELGYVAATDAAAAAAAAAAADGPTTPRRRRTKQVEPETPPTRRSGRPAGSPDASGAAGSSGGGPIDPARPAARHDRAQAGSDSGDGWAEALEWLADNDDASPVGEADLSVPLLRLIDAPPRPVEPSAPVRRHDEPSTRSAGETSAGVTSGWDPEVPDWLSEGFDQPPAPGESAPGGDRDGDLFVDPLAFLGDSPAHDEVGADPHDEAGGSGAPARIDADPVTRADGRPEDAVADEPGTAAPSADGTAAPRRRHRPLRAR